MGMAPATASLSSFPLQSKWRSRLGREGNGSRPVSLNRPGLFVCGGARSVGEEGGARASGQAARTHLSHCLLLPFKWFRTQLQPACRGYVNVGKQPSQSQVGPASRCLTQLNGGGLFDHAAAMTLARPVPAQIFFVGILLI